MDRQEKNVSLDPSSIHQVGYIPTTKENDQRDTDCNVSVDVDTSGRVDTNGCYTACFVLF